jgi:hypothetical protein
MERRNRDEDGETIRPHERQAQREAMALLAAKPETESQQKPQQAPSAPMVPQPATIQ